MTKVGSSLPSRRLTFVKLCIGGSLVFLAFGTIMAALPTWLYKAGWSPVMIGVIVGSHAVGAMTFRIAGLKLVDRIGPRRAAGLGATFGVAACLLLPAGMGTEDRWMALLILTGAKLGHGAAQACYITAALTASAGSDGDGGVDARRIGIFSGIAAVGLLIGPPVGLALIQSGYVDLVFSLPALCFLGALFTVPEDGFSFSSQINNRSRDFRRLPPGVRHNFAAMSALALGALLQGGAEAQLPTVVSSLGIADGLLAIYVAFGLAVAAAKTASGFICEHIGEEGAIGIGLVICSVALLIPVLHAETVVLVLCGALLGAGSGLIGTATVILVTKASSEHQRGATIGICAIVQDVCLAAGAVAAGWAIVAAGPMAFFVVGFAATSAAFVGFAVFQYGMNWQQKR